MLFQIEFSIVLSWDLLLYIIGIFFFYVPSCQDQDQI